MIKKVVARHNLITTVRDTVAVKNVKTLNYFILISGKLKAHVLQHL